jgi:peptidoglycan/LPS O-acetylase OafA/YrhL
MAAGYRADIDGLRAAAVALVVGFHAFPAVISGGFVGVDVFFVISGYLITGLILDRQATGRFSIKDFYVRRARRILPALGTVITATLVIGWFVLLPVAYEKLGLHALAGSLFFPNLIFWSEAGYFDVAAKAKPLLHLWSLGIEEQFYMIWPALLIAVRRWRANTTLILCAFAALSLIYSSIEVFSNTVAAFYSPLSRLWELSLGGILAARYVKLRHPEIASLLGIALIVVAGLILTNASRFPGLLAVMPAGGAALAIAGRSSILRWRPFVALGLISYPLYLWHWPLLSFAAISGFDTLPVRFAVVAVSILLAWATTRYIESPVRFGALRARGASISAGVTFAVAICGTLIFWSGGMLLRYPQAIRPVLATMDYKFHLPARYGKCWLAANWDFSHYKSECSDGTILMWGDSYSALLATGLPKPYAQFSRDGCLPLIDPGPGQCAHSNVTVADKIVQLKPRRVILFGAWLFHVENWQADPKLTGPLRATLRRLRADIDDVVLVGPSPDWLPENLPAVVFKFWSETGLLPDRIKLPSEKYQATDRIMRDVALGEGVRFVSFFDAICNADGCLTHDPASRSELLFWDHGHLTLEGANYLVAKMSLAQISWRTH